MQEKVSCKFKLKMQYHSGTLIDGCVGPQYQKVLFNDFTLTISKPNNCCILADNKIILVENIAFSNNIPVILGRNFFNKVNFYTQPCSSSLIGIFKVNKLSHLKRWDLNLVKKKCVSIKLKKSDEFVIFPLLHCP